MRDGRRQNDLRDAEEWMQWKLTDSVTLEQKEKHDSVNMVDNELMGAVNFGDTED